MILVDGEAGPKIMKKVTIIDSLSSSVTPETHNCEDGGPYQTGL